MNLRFVMCFQYFYNIWQYDKTQKILKKRKEIFLWNFYIGMKCFSAGKCVQMQRHPRNMWPNIVILEICGRTLSSWQYMADHCHPGFKWPRIVILATCDRAFSSCQYLPEHCHPGNMWPSIVILATRNRELSSWQHVA